MPISVCWIVLQQPVQQWQETDAASLSSILMKAHETGYRAIPSMLASLLAGKQSNIHGRMVHLAPGTGWRLWASSDSAIPFVHSMKIPFLIKKKRAPCLQARIFVYKLKWAALIAGSIFMYDAVAMWMRS